MTPTPSPGTDPQEFRRRGLRRLRMATAAVGAAAVVGTGGITLAVAEPPAPAGEVDGGTPASTAATPPPAPPPGEAGPQPPAQAPEPAAPGNADASSGGS